MVEVVRRFRCLGKVQGVYFRHSTRLEAKRLRLRGLARNLPDGSVEVLAQGAAAAVGCNAACGCTGDRAERVSTAVREITPADERDGAANAGRISKFAR